ncbi:GNAT family N-acetyltransferase [Micromonospora krabiensis]|uniref:Acetyltransferase (GNAT) family protein n=1 Tax=Micromonospora krabiensis TaxID=307121 RepID=A0A1C3MWR8_9ACTN|nr:GNAT family N-acetyltransferase [Micromonospora krabiensis]SBV24771.1 Acetyltransferase (GNAT) family protein [Micromonospora krabiensis]
MQAAPRIRPGHWTDKEPVAALIAEALDTQPVGAWLVPEPSQRRRVLADVLAIWIEHAMFFGDIYLTDDRTAAAVGFHRYRPIPLPANYGIRLPDAAGAYTDRFSLLDQLLAVQQPSEPHYHLAFLAVAPSTQGTGRGTALLEHHRSRVDRIGLPSYATPTEGASRLYTRYGYTPRRVITLPDGPTIHPMRRNPSAVDSAWPIDAAGSASDAGSRRRIT